MKRSRYSILKDVKVDRGTVLFDQVNLYKCDIGKNCKIDAFVYSEGDVKIGDNVKIRTFTVIGEGTRIEDDVYIGPNVSFTTDKYPRAKGRWRLLRTVIKKGASICAGVVIGPGVTIGAYALVGAGSVVTKDVEDYAIVVGCPARVVGHVTDEAFKSKVRHFLQEAPAGDLRGKASEWPWP